MDKKMPKNITNSLIKRPLLCHNTNQPILSGQDRPASQKRTHN